MNQRHAIVLAGDYGYIRPIEAALKSIVYHNHSLKIYIFNQDIPREWFQNLRRHLALVNSELIDVKLLDDRLDKNWTAGFVHINYMAFARYFIPLHVDEDKVLYLDSDLVVTGDIKHMFDINLENYYVAGVNALHGISGYFNSGVILINNKKWREEDVFSGLIEFTKNEWENVLEGDQSILNLYFDDNWLKLDPKYNFPIGYDYGAYVEGQQFVFDFPITPLPLILHYISSDKPWNTFSSGRLRDIWWFYNALEWSEIIQHHNLPKENCIQLIKTRLNCLTLTNSQDLEHLELLIKSLPDCHFHIAAYTPMGSKLIVQSQYPNVTLYPEVIPVVLDDLISQSDLYLDINYGDKFFDVLENLKQRGKILMSFENTSQDRVEELICPSDTPEALIGFIKIFENCSK